MTNNERTQKMRFNVAHDRYYPELKCKYSLSKVIKFGKEILEDSRFVIGTKRIIPIVIENCDNFIGFRANALSNWKAPS